MSNQHLSYLNEKGTVWFNPCYAIRVFWQEFEKFKKERGLQHEEAWRHRDFKRHKEIYTTSIAAKIAEKQEGGRWWITKPKQDPPDGVIGTIQEKNGMPWMSVREVEVVEHFGGDVVDTIRTKLAKKKYEPNTYLLCYLSAGGLHDFKKVSAELANEETSLESIFLVFPGVPLDSLPKNATNDELIRAVYRLSAVRVKPGYDYGSIDPIADCAEWATGSEGNFFIYEGRGRGGGKPITMTNPPKLF